MVRIANDETAVHQRRNLADAASTALYRLLMAYFLDLTYG
jgi:hypothetical protein